MNSFFSRFYFLSKFTTSLILLILLILLSYVLIKAYLEQEHSNSSNMKIEVLSNQISNLADIVDQNSNNLYTVKSLVQDNKRSVQDINYSLETFNGNRVNNDLLLKIDKLFEKNNKLQNELSDISSVINNLETFQLSSLQDKKISTTVNNIVKLIKLKLNSGLSFSEEVLLLKELKHSAEYISNVEKLSIYATEDFLSLDQLNTNFDQLSSRYLNDYYLKKNNNYFIKHFFNLVLIKPNVDEDVENETVLLLSLAKQRLIEKNLNESIKQLNKLNDGEYFFSTWMKQAVHYDQVTDLLNKL